MQKYTDRNNLVGKLGEIYVADNIIHQLQDKGLRWSSKTEPLTYRIRYQYRGCRGRSRGGIDEYLVLRDEERRAHRCFIEISNWMRLRNCNDYIFHKRIQSKFEKYDPDNMMYHVLAMNYRNLPLIVDRCQEHNIHIIPLREHITPEFVHRLIKENAIV